MPLYDFQCECGHQEERLEAKWIDDLPCPDCAGRMRARFPSRIHIANSTQTYHRRVQTIGEKFRRRPQELAILKARVEARGGVFSLEDAYHDCLAQRPLDPEGIVPHDDPLGHIRRLSERRGDPCEGMVTVKAVQKDPELRTGPPIAEDILQKLMAERIRKEPALAQSKGALSKLREDVINRHAPAT